MGRLGLAVSVLMISTIAALGMADNASAGRKATQDLLNQMQAQTQRPKAADNLQGTAGRIVDWLAQGKFTEVTQTFDATMRPGLPPDKLKQVWQSVVAQAGPLNEKWELAFRRCSSMMLSR